MIVKRTGRKSGKSATNLGRRATNGKYPPTPLAYFRKTLPKNNILIGDDPAQLRFLAQQLNREVTQIEGDPITAVDKVTDDMLLGYEGLLLQVSAEYRIDLSPDVKSRTGIWDAGPIRKNSAGAHAIVRQAAAILKISDKLPAETMNFVAGEITKYGLEDVRGALWAAVWHLTGDCTPEPAWIEPWQDPVRWFNPKNDPVYRLEGLYLTLVAWGFLVTREPLGLKQLHITPVHEAYLQTLRLDEQRVYDSIKQLSNWRMQRTDPMLCALAIACIWRR
jgi:hypothetical protein